MKPYSKNMALVFNTMWDGASPWCSLEKMAGRHLSARGAWLDLACGTGDLLARAHAAGFACTGTDYSRAQLRYAREKCPQAQFVQAAMQKVRLGRKFDVITCLGGSIHHLENRRQLKQFFQSAKRHLMRGGVFVFDFNTFVRRLDADNEYVGGALTYREPGQFVCIEFTYDESRRTSNWTTTGFLKEGRLYRKFEEKHALRAHPIKEVEELLGEVGFRFKKYDTNSKSMRPRKESIELYFKCWLREG